MISKVHEQFPKMKFTVRNICVKKYIRYRRNNCCYGKLGHRRHGPRWELVHNGGVSIINIKFGKACSVTDYILNPGDKFRSTWGVAENITRRFFNKTSPELFSTNRSSQHKGVRIENRFMSNLHPAIYRFYRKAGGLMPDCGSSAVSHT